MSNGPRWAKHPLWALTWTRLLEFMREPGAVFWVFVFPILIAVGLGIAFRNKPPETMRVAVIAAPGAERVVQAIDRSPDLEGVILGEAEANAQLKRAKIDLVVITSSAASPRVSYRFDPEQPKSRTARLVADAVLEAEHGRKDVLAKIDVPPAEAGERYIDYLVPGLIGLNLMGSSMWGIGYAVVITRSRKLMKRFAATPMRRSHYLLSFMLSRFSFLFLEVAVLIAFGRLAFDVTVHGSYLDLSIVTAVGALAFAGISLLVGARPQSIEAANGWLNFVMLPMWFLSGALFSYERFPDVVVPILRALPLTALNDALRAVMNDGRSIVDLWRELIVLAAWTLGSFVVALRIFRWQ